MVNFFFTFMHGKFPFPDVLIRTSNRLNLRYVVGQQFRWLSRPEAKAAAWGKGTSPLTGAHR